MVIFRKQASQGAETWTWEHAPCWTIGSLDLFRNRRGISTGIPCPGFGVHEKTVTTCQTGIATCSNTKLILPFGD